ncbi:MAG: polysaccharide biosynthesis C-terminal domain-containing protein [Lutibacter sp.]|uniref:oligosaccharide flippase family protein n=1 Tax=Lutibacter sp. TaxID=1925666 RepID=UPI00385C06A4
MGIVLRQSFINTLILFVGFTIGGINVIFLFTHFLHEDYFGLITFLLSTANIILPLLVFGMQHTVIKFYSSYKTKVEQDSFLISTIFLPLLVIIPLGIISVYFYDAIASWLSSENILIKDYTGLIFITAIFMGYFEVFYSWTKVQFNSVFGNFIKEIFARICTSLLLVAVYFKWLTNEEFIYAVVIVYGLRVLIMKLYAFYICRPAMVLKLPSNIKEILSFSLYIIVAGSAAGVLLEIDKFMIPQMKQIAEVAYYSVGIYIASVVAIPTRAMQHITSPITAKYMNENKVDDVEKLYKQTSINLLVIGGLLFLLINLNVNDLYEFINKPQFAKGSWIVLIISVAKLLELALGTANAILVNSKYYKIFFYLSLAMAFSVILLNKWLINLIGINGAALATLIVVAFYSIFKIIYIKGKLNIQPFSIQTIKLLISVLIIFISFNFWSFSFHPILNILLKSSIIGFVYFVIVKKLHISKEINLLVAEYFQSKFKK